MLTISCILIIVILFIWSNHGAYDNISLRWCVEDAPSCLRYLFEELADFLCKGNHSRRVKGKLLFVVASIYSGNFQASFT